MHSIKTLIKYASYLRWKKKITDILSWNIYIHLSEGKNQPQFKAQTDSATNSRRNVVYSRGKAARCQATRVISSTYANKFHNLFSPPPPPEHAGALAQSYTCIYGDARLAEIVIADLQLGDTRARVYIPRMINELSSRERKELRKVGSKRGGGVAARAYKEGNYDNTLSPATLFFTWATAAGGAHVYI